MTDHASRRRRAAAAAWNLNDDECVLVGAGERIPIPGGADQTYPFRPHSEYFYLAERSRPGSVLVYDSREGWIDFVPEVTAAERVWEGAGESDGVPLTQLQQWLDARRGRRFAVLGSPVSPVVADSDLTARLREQLSAVRRPKDDLELARMRRAVDATAAGFAAIQPLIRPGVTERQIQIEIEAEFYRAGATATGYDTIVGSGPNSAVLHFQPTARLLQEGELLLIDAGAAVDAYVADVTRTYPIAPAFSAEQRDLYTVVRTAQVAAAGRCRAGVEFADLHVQTARDFAAALVDLGLLRGNPDVLVERGTVALFFPHGLGHLVGLGVRDASGRAPGRPPREGAATPNLRLDMPLQPGFTVTIEPGLYFIPAILTDDANRAQHRDAVDWGRVDRMLDFGGIRIEDDVLVTDGEPVILTADIPK